MPGRSLLLAGLIGVALAGCASAPRPQPERGSAVPAADDEASTRTPQSPERAAGAADTTAAAAPAESTMPGGAADTAADPRGIFLSRAHAMLGQPYRYGGKQPGGFDCSGLVSYAASGAGIALPRTTRELMRVGKRIRRSQIEPGDLVFMRLQHRVLHVGIALGDDLFIHAPSYGERVRIDSLAAPPYSRHFLGARRVLDGEATAHIPP